MTDDEIKQLYKDAGGHKPAAWDMTFARAIESATIERLASCLCRDCRKVRLDPSVYPVRREMILCEICGNKRCPHATNHNHACTESNDPGQTGSEYQFAWSAASEIDAAVNRTIERCAEVCEELDYPKGYEYASGSKHAGFDEAREDCAAAIRALKGER